MKPTVYIETTIISYLTAWPSGDIIRAARQQITREWWDLHSADFTLYTSQLVVVEAAAGDARAASDRLAAIAGLAVLDVNDRAVRLAQELVRTAAMPSVAIRDAEHVGIAATNGIDYLLTWNCRHLANAVLRDRIEQVCEQDGLKCPKICTPEELLGGQS